MLDLEELTGSWLGEDTEATEAIIQMTEGLIDYLLQSESDAREFSIAIANGRGIQRIAERISSGIAHVIGEVLIQYHQQGRFTPPAEEDVSDLEE